MPKLPVLQGRDLLRLLESAGFKITGRKGSHVRLRSDDGRAVTVPVHTGRDLPKGLLRKIIREDLGMEVEEFVALWRKRGK